MFFVFVLFCFVFCFYEISALGTVPYLWLRGGGDVYRRGIFNAVEMEVRF